MKYNLQFFAEGDSNGESGDDIQNSATSDSNTSGNSTDEISALADLVSEKDKIIQQLEQDISELKKSNAQLIVKVNAATQPATPKKSFEENLLDMVGAKPRKE